jgi:tetratricopeptide (TPR) repeat protein
MKRFVAICMLLCASIISSSQNGLNPTEELILCERGYFESTDPVEQNNWLLKKAFVYHSNGEYLQAINTYDRLRYEMLGDSLLSTVFLKLAANTYLLGDFDEAIAFCNMIPENDFQKYVIMDALLIKVLSYSHLGDYQQAHQMINSYIAKLEIGENKKDSLTILMDLFFTAELLPVLLDPSRAELLSMLLPGLGHCYSGHYVEGAANFTTHILIAAFSGYAAYKTYYLTAYFGGVNLLMKFYFGTPKRSAYLAERRNYAEQQQFMTDIKAKIDELRVYENR